MPKACAIKGCGSTFDLLKFPNPEQHLDRFRSWVAATGNTELLSYHPIKIYNTLFVCSRHFDPIFLAFDTTTIPHLNLPESIVVPEDWIIVIEAEPENIDLRNNNKHTSVTFKEDEVMAMVDIWNTTYNSVNNHIPLKMYETSKITEFDLATSDVDMYNLWKTADFILEEDSIETKQKMKSESDLNGNCQYTQYVLTKPSDYYNKRWNALQKMYEEQLELNRKQERTIRELRKQEKRLKMCLLTQHT